jgi:hypothetical protein
MPDLTPEQKKTITKWITEGASLADIQKRLREELGLSLTYIDVRLLVLDMGLSVKEKVRQAAPVGKDLGKAGSRAAEAPEEDDDAMDENEAAAPMPPDGAGARRVAVSLDRIVKPGALVSGTVTFGDGVTVGWALDQFGRLALTGGKPGYKPSQQDIMAFQSELRRLLEQKGF